MIKEKNERYKLIDVDSLATALSEDAWEEDVKAKGLTREDLYQAIIVIGNEAPLQEQIRPEWACNFFALRDKYLSLINECKAPRNETSKKAG